MGELTPGAIGRLLDGIEMRGEEGIKASLVAIAQQAERQAKINANTGSHRKGEPHTPGTGPGPNVVTGNLRRSITHTQPARDSQGWYVKVGVAATAAYGRYVEPRYPFLLPAAQSVKAKVVGLVKPQFKWR